MARHPGTIDRHGNRWRVRLCVRGERSAYTLREGTTEAEAVQFAYEQFAELRSQPTGKCDPRVAFGPTGPMRFSELLTEYRAQRLADMSTNSRRTYPTSLAAFWTFFVELSGDPEVSEIGRGAVNGFMTWRRRHGPDGTPLQAPLAAGTMRNDRIRLSGLFRFAEDLEVVETNPVKRVQPPKGDTRNPVILNATQYEALLAQCEGRPMLALYTLTLGEAGPTQ